LQGPGQNSKTLWQTLKIWGLPTLSVILKHSLITSSETGDWGFQASSGPPGSKFSNCHFAPHSSKSIHAFRPCTRWCKFFFACLDLTDALFCICLAPQSQPVFAFQWENPNTGEKGQLIWTQLPQDFKNSPTIFGTALAFDLKDFSAIQYGCTLLQYVDDLLQAWPTQ
jgi:hypothetical protein